MGSRWIAVGKKKGGVSFPACRGKKDRVDLHTRIRIIFHVDDSKQVPIFLRCIGKELWFKASEVMYEPKERDATGSTIAVLSFRCSGPCKRSLCCI